MQCAVVLESIFASTQERTVAGMQKFPQFDFTTLFTRLDPVINTTYYDLAFHRTQTSTSHSYQNGSPHEYAFERTAPDSSGDGLS